MAAQYIDKSNLVREHGIKCTNYDRHHYNTQSDHKSIIFSDSLADSAERGGGGAWYYDNMNTFIRGLFGKFVEFGHKTFKYLYNPFIFLNITGGH